MTNSNQNDSRKDGRQPLDLRPVRITSGFTKHAEGAALIEMGETRVLCTATVEEKVPSLLKTRAWDGSRRNMRCCRARPKTACRERQAGAVLRGVRTKSSA